MKDILFVDGYNIIHAWPELRDITARVNLQASRERLSDIIGSYAAFTGLRATIVFDAHMVKDAHSKVEKYPGVTVVYTKEHQTADSYIEISVAKLDRYAQNIYVATSDGAQQLLVLSQGANRISARELLNQINSKKHERRQIKQESSSMQLDNHLDSETKRKLMEFMKTRGR